MPIIRPGTSRALLAALAMLAAGAANAGSSTNPKQADGPGIFVVEQVNMCAWGSRVVANYPCFPNRHAEGSAAWKTEEKRQADLKRQSVVNQIRWHDPDVLTANEVCRGDMQQVTTATGYKLHAYEAGRGNWMKNVRGKAPRQCSLGRGDTVNAILVKKTLLDSGRKGAYFRSNGFRSWLCADVKTPEYSKVSVCTAHFSTLTQESGTTLHAQECSRLSAELGKLAGKAVFAGDVNSKSKACKPSGYSAIKDASTAYPSTGGLQHVYYKGFYRQSCGWAYAVAHTDHPGYTLELGNKKKSMSCPSRNL